MGDHSSAPVSGAGVAERELAERAPGVGSARRTTGAGTAPGVTVHVHLGTDVVAGRRPAATLAATAPAATCLRGARGTCEILVAVQGSPGAGADVLDLRICRLDYNWPARVHHLRFRCGSR